MNKHPRIFWYLLTSFKSPLERADRKRLRSTIIYHQSARIALQKRRFLRKLAVLRINFTLMSRRMQKKLRFAMINYVAGASREDATSSFMGISSRTFWHKSLKLGSVSLLDLLWHTISPDLSNTDALDNGGGSTAAYSLMINVAFMDVFSTVHAHAIYYCILPT